RKSEEYRKHDRSWRCINKDIDNQRQPPSFCHSAMTKRGCFRKAKKRRGGVPDAHPPLWRNRGGEPFSLRRFLNRGPGAPSVSGFLIAAVLSCAIVPRVSVAK